MALKITASGNSRTLPLQKEVITPIDSFDGLPSSALNPDLTYYAKDTKKIYQCLEPIPPQEIDTERIVKDFYDPPLTYTFDKRYIKFTPMKMADGWGELPQSYQIGELGFISNGGSGLNGLYAYAAYGVAPKTYMDEEFTSWIVLWDDVLPEYTYLYDDTEVIFDLIDKKVYVLYTPDKQQYQYFENGIKIISLSNPETWENYKMQGSQAYDLTLIKSDTMSTVDLHAYFTAFNIADFTEIETAIAGVYTNLDKKVEVIESMAYMTVPDLEDKAYYAKDTGMLYHSQNPTALNEMKTTYKENYENTGNYPNTCRYVIIDLSGLNESEGFGFRDSQSEQKYLFLRKTADGAEVVACDSTPEVLATLYYPMAIFDTLTKSIIADGEEYTHPSPQDLLIFGANDNYGIRTYPLIMETNEDYNLFWSYTFVNLSDTRYIPVEGGTLTGMLYTQDITPNMDSFFNLGGPMAKYNLIYGVTAMVDNVKALNTLKIPTTAPTTPEAGHIYLDDTTPALMVYTSAGWKTINL
jgi:hypothetical protein